MYDIEVPYFFMLLTFPVRAYTLKRNDKLSRMQERHGSGRESDMS